MMRWIVLTMLLVPFMASAADFWDGNAALQRGDADFESGLNVTSNSFPPGTKITILDEDTGKTVTATVTGRIEGQSDILMLMSPKTAEALGVSQGTLGRVRVTVPEGMDTAAAAQPGDQNVSRDPDVNPAASAAAAPEPAAGTTAIAQTPESATTSPAAESATPPAESSTTPSAEAPAAEAPAVETPAAETPATETPATETPATEAPAATPEAVPDQTGTAEQPANAAQAGTPASGEDADAAAILSQAEARNPQKEMFQPPREDQKFVYHPETTPSQTGTSTPPSTATVASVSEPAVPPPASAQGDLPLADVTAPEESRPQEIVGAGTAVPPAAAPETALAAPEVAPAEQTAVAAAPTQTEVIGQGAAPPAGTPAPKVALAAPEAPTAAGTSTAIASAATPSTPGTVTPRQPTAVTASATSVPRTGPGTFYLQLAAYGSEKGARDLAAKLAPTYPALVLAPASGGSSTFKVVIGPLNKAESGTLLMWFRYRGFPDAFLKQQ
jgi:hypothetical protein